MRSRILVGVIVVVVGAALGLVIAGPPDFGEEPVEVRTGSAGADTDDEDEDDDGTDADDDGTSTTTTSGPATTAVGSASTSTTVAAGKDVRVRAYNSSSTAGAAGDVTARLKTAGYTMQPAATGPKDKTAETRVLFKPGFEAQAKAVATLLELPAERVKAFTTERLPSVEDTDVMVLVGDDVV